MSKRRPRTGPSSPAAPQRSAAKRSAPAPSAAPAVPSLPAPSLAPGPIDADPGGSDSTAPQPTAPEPTAPKPGATASALTESTPTRSTPAIPGSKVGRTELGVVSIDDRVVEKIAARATVEVRDAGAAAPRVLGRSLAGLASHAPAGVRQTSLDALPKVSADVDGSIVTVDLQISVRWPCSVPEVTAAVRRHVGERVGELTGLTVSDIRIQVTDLVTHLAPPPRVH